ncbi:MAG: hypothetical protein JNL28_09350 [Planctomycetes bacterium]|nr:hypothetical protein [Planctomycetota bacterium]
MLRDAERLLRTEGAFAVDAQVVPWARIAQLLIAAGVLYGAVMGALAVNPVGVLYSALKLPVLLAFALAICLPNFYAMHAVLGLREDFPAAVRGILSAQGTLAVALCALAPVTGFFYLCGVTYPGALLWNGGAFAIAVICGQITLARHYRALIARNRRHRLTLAAWFLLYTFVSIKVGWVLRPFIGDPALPIEFLRAGKWSENPYMNLFWTAAAFVWNAANKLAGAD